MKQIALEDIEETELRARLWNTVFNLRLTIYPPAREGAEWIARTNGGVHDEHRLLGTGKTPELAVQDLLDTQAPQKKRTPKRGHKRRRDVDPLA